MLALDPDAVVWNLPADVRHQKPLLILMHGRGSDENDLVSLVPALPAGFAIASVRAPYAEGFGWSWFDAESNAPGDPHPENADLAADGVLAWMRGLGWVPPTVGALGFSQGGAMAVHLMRRDPHRITFAVNLAGFVVRGEQFGDATLTMRRNPVFWGRGADDPLFTPELLQRAEHWLPLHTSLTSGHYAGLGHAISPEELSDVSDFLRMQLASANRSA